MIDILLSTYNGEVFLGELIDSVMGQTYQDCRLLVRDDGSTDGTLGILRTYQDNYPQRIVLTNDMLGNVGVIKSFELLLANSSSEYIMFCDQDDVWLPNKVELSVLKMQEAEKHWGAVPLLVFSDLRVVNERLQTQNESFWRQNRLKMPIATKFQFVCVANCVTGCTILMNKAAKDICLPFPENIPMHDWWIAGKVAKTGHLLPLCQHTILYRQHEKNVWGTKEIDSKYYVKRFFQLRQVLAEAKKLRPFLQALGFGGLWRFWYYKCLYFFLRRL